LRKGGGGLDVRTSARFIEMSARSCAAVTTAVVLSACGGGSGPDEPPEVGAIEAAGWCLEREGYVVEEDVGKRWLVVSSRDGSKSARIDAFRTASGGDEYLSATSLDDAGPALADAIVECTSAYHPPSFGNPP
jgi:hypothetical protein